MNKDNEVFAWGNPEDGYVIWDQADQLTLEFNVAGSLAELLMQPGITSKDIEKRIYDNVDTIMEKYADDLRKTGVRVFEIQQHNDRKSVETDYGAPAQGISFFRDVMDATRSFRYEPVYVLDDIYQTHHGQAVDIGKAQKEAGFHTFDDMEEEAYPAQIHFTNGGATKGFSDIIEEIVGEYDEQKEYLTPLGLQRPGVILVPVPNYGLFLWRMQDAVSKKDIEIVPVRRRDDGSVEQVSLKNILEDCRLRNKRVLAYYDCNPQNPTGHIREKEETEQIYALIEQHNELEADRIIGHMMARGVVPENRPYVTRWLDMMRSVHHRPILIDDMSYEGLELDPQKKPYSFAQVSVPAAQSTAVLKGVSKIGLPGARIGMVMAHAGLVVPMAHKQLMKEFSAHSPGVDILAARFGTGPSRDLFTSHQDDLRVQHRHRVGIIKAFFHGIEKVSELDAAQKESLIENYAQHAEISKAEAGERLSGGLTKFTLPDTMDCGFFYRINCESLRNHPISVKFTDSTWISTARIDNSDTLHWVFRSFGMHEVPAHRQGCSNQTLMVRITTSLPEKDLFRFYDNMREMQTYFFGEKPQAQLDLFRGNHHVPAIG